jgi:HSP20 family protein
MATAVGKPARQKSWPVMLDPIASIREELDSLLSHVTTERPDAWLLSRGVPMCDLSETGSEVQVRFDMPGMNAKDIDIQLSGNVLTVSGERKEEKEEKGRTFHRVERRQGTFSRSLTLPCAVSEDAVDAQYKEGVLTVTMQKTEEARTRKITVRT